MINDIMAMLCGKAFGRNKLIALSPSKTWEGFLGGGISTVIFAFLLSDYIAQWPRVTCPETEITFTPFRTMNCSRPAMYDKKPRDIPLIGQMMIADS